MKVPYCESLLTHRGRDLKRIAAWVFERLDSEPLEGTGRFTFYLCYHSSDQFLFSDPQDLLELKDNLLEIYINEKKWDDRGFGNLSFAIQYDRRTERMYIRRSRKASRRGLARLIKNGSASDAHDDPKEIEFCWMRADAFSRPGVLGLVRCSRRSFGMDDLVTASIRLEGNWSLSRHLENSQNGSRWQEPVVYLSDKLAAVSIGQGPGCDIQTDAVTGVLRISYDSREAVWKQKTNDPGGGEVSKPGSLELEMGGSDARRLRLECRAVERPRPLRDFERENRLPLFSVHIMGRVFPKNNHIPEEFPAKHLKDIVSALQLPGDKWLYMMRGNSIPFLLDPGSLNGRTWRKGGPSMSEGSRPMEQIKPGLGGRGQAMRRTHFTAENFSFRLDRFQSFLPDRGKTISRPSTFLITWIRTSVGRQSSLSRGTVVRTRLNLKKTQHTRYI